jgi:glutamate racemase
MPYGTKTDQEIVSLTVAAIQPLLTLNCDSIVIACNTATTVAIKHLRDMYPDVRFIGIEPMVKPAAQLTNTGVIAVCATPGTLRSKRYNELKESYARGITIIEPDCSSWALRIENDETNTIDVEATVASLIAQDVDVIVLGCTHYHWLKQRFVTAAGPDITVLEPSDAIAKRIADLVR